MACSHPQEAKHSLGRHPATAASAFLSASHRDVSVHQGKASSVWVFSQLFIPLYVPPIFFYNFSDKININNW